VVLLIGVSVLEHEYAKDKPIISAKK
jgi:hypothetical protein